MEVVFCTSGIFPESIGGIQRHSRLLIEALSVYDDVQLTVIHPHSKTQFQSHQKIKEIQIPFNHQSGYYLYNCYLFSKLVYNHLKLMPNAIVYSQGLCVWYSASELKHRLIYNPHGLEPFQALNEMDNYKLWPFRFFMKRLFKQSKYVISLGGMLTEILQHAGVATNKIKEIPNATLVPQTLPLKRKSDPFTFLFVGRFADNKGINVLMQAITQISNDKLLNMRFILVGGGPLFQKITTQYHLPNVVYTGFASDNDLIKIYDESNAFVLPTLFEGMPTVVLEAMAKAMPIIVTNVGATALLVNKDNGYLIQKNNVNQLKDAIIKMTNLTDTEYKALSQNSFNKVKESFSWTTVAAQHHKLFKDLNDKNKA